MSKRIMKTRIRRSLSRILPVESTRKTACAALYAQLTRDDLAAVETKCLHTVESQEPDAGSKPLYRLADDDGRQYVLKAAPAFLASAEEVAFRLRALARRPTVPARRVKIPIDGGPVVEGLIKPFVEFDETHVLDADTRTWTPLQRSVILVEHAWEWFLDNMDTNAGQYLLLGPHAYPVNLDWDRAFSSNRQPELSRFAKYRQTLPNARTFLYADYVEGRVSLSFDLLEREARTIERLPEAEVRRCLDQLEGEGAEEHVARALERRATLVRAFREFVRELQAERRSLRHDEQGFRRLAASAWKRWQVVLDKTFHGPVGHLGRAVLKRMRQPSSQPSAPRR